MIEITMNDGSVINYDIIANFNLEDTNNSYIVYTDGVYENGELNIYAVICDWKNGKVNYVTSKEEWSLIIEKMSKLGFRRLKYGK